MRLVMGIKQLMDEGYMTRNFNHWQTFDIRNNMEVEDFFFHYYTKRNYVIDMNNSDKDTVILNEVKHG